jgi:hypothetical protein
MSLAAAVYLLFAVIGRFVEGMGAVECGCADKCWCKRPALSTFCWVFPWGHGGPTQVDWGLGRLGGVARLHPSDVPISGQIQTDPPA